MLFVMDWGRRKVPDIDRVISSTSKPATPPADESAPSRGDACASPSIDGSKAFTRRARQASPLRKEFVPVSAGIPLRRFPFQLQMLIRRPGRAPALACSGDHRRARLKKIRLDHVLQRIALLPHRRRDRIDADRPALVHFNQRAQEGAVLLIEAFFVDAFELEASRTISIVSARRLLRPHSRARRNSRLAMRGVPRLRSDNSASASGSAIRSSSFALASRIRCSAAGG